MPANKTDCAQCLELIVWQCGHGTETRVLAIQEMIKSIKSQLGKLSPQLDNINSTLDDIGLTVNEFSRAPSPFLLESVEINLLITNRINKLKKLEQYQVINFHLDLAPDQMFVNANSVWLRRLLDILIDNAVEAMKTCETKHLTIKTAVHEQRARITVSDTGRGIAQETINSFLQKPDALAPSGRGAYIAHLIAEIYGGSIEIESTGNTGTSLVIWLPISK